MHKRKRLAQKAFPSVATLLLLKSKVFTPPFLLTCLALRVEVQNKKELLSLFYNNPLNCVVPFDIKLSSSCKKVHSFRQLLKPLKVRGNSTGGRLVLNKEVRMKPTKK